MGTEQREPYTITLDGHPLSIGKGADFHVNFDKVDVDSYFKRKEILEAEFTIIYRVDRWLRKVFNKMVLFGNLKN